MAIKPFVCAILATANSLACPVHAQEWNMSRVVDSSMAVPGGGVFIGLGSTPFDRPSLGLNGRVAFHARYDQSTREGVFTNSTGPLATVANFSTQVPGSSQPFGSLSTPSYDGGPVAFSGGNLSGDGGVYSWTNGTITTVVDNHTPMPGGGEFGPVGLASQSGNRTIFRQGSTQAFYQANAGAFSLVVQPTDPAPGGGQFTAFTEAQLSGTSIAIQASVGPTRQGIFAASLSSQPVFSTIADTNTAIPNGVGNFRTLGAVSVSNGNIAFLASDAQLHPGVYARINGQLLNIADTLHPGPGGIQFSSFDSVSISGENVAFVCGVLGGGKQLWVLRQGEFSRVVAGGTVLNGLTVARMEIGPESLKGDTIAFSFIESINGPFPIKGGVYTATFVPGPGGVGIAAAAALYASRRQRARE